MDPGVGVGWIGSLVVGWLDALLGRGPSGLKNNNPLLPNIHLGDRKVVQDEVTPNTAAPEQCQRFFVQKKNTESTETLYCRNARQDTSSVIWRRLERQNTIKRKGVRNGTEEE